MALKKKKPARVQVAQSWMNEHNRVACATITVIVAAALTSLFLFIAFSGFGASADFIYNQF